MASSSISSGLLWSYAERWGNKIISFAVFIVLARLLSPTDFGLLALAKLFIDYAESLAGQGLSLSIIQRAEVLETHLSSAFWMNVICSILLTGVICFIAPMAERFLDAPGLSDVLQALSMIVVIGALSRVQVALLNRHHAFRQLASRGLVTAIVGGAVGITFAMLGHGVWSLVYQSLAGAIVSVCLLWRVASWRPRYVFDIAALRQLYSYATRVIANLHVTFISNRIDEALIGALLGPTMLGYYSIAKRLYSTVVEMLYSVLAKVLLTVFAKKQHDLASLTKRAENVARNMAAFCFPPFLVGGIFAPEIVQIVFGNQWLPAWPALTVLMFAGVLALTINVLHPLFNAVGRPGIPLKANIFRLTASLIFIPVGVSFGLLGAAVAIFMRIGAGALFDLWLFKKHLKQSGWGIIKAQAISLSYCIPSVLIMLLVSYQLRPYAGTALSLGVFIGSGAIVYLATLVITKARIITEFRSVLAAATSRSPSDSPPPSLDS